MKLPHRRIFLAGCIAAGITAFARPGHSAESESLPRRGPPVARHWVIFEAAALKARKADSPAEVEAIMLAELGPLPWLFDTDANPPRPAMRIWITRLARMDNPEPGEATGVWAVARSEGDGPAGVMLIQIGRIVLKMGTRTDFREGFERLYRETGAKRASITYRRIGDDGCLLSAGFEDRDDLMAYRALNGGAELACHANIATGKVALIAATPTL